MHKLSTIAKQFDIKRTELIEALIDHRILLDGHVNKRMGITYVDDRGVEILYKLLIDESSTKQKNDSKDIPPNAVMKEYEDYQNIEEKLRLSITELKNDILALDTEIQKKDNFLIDYMERLLEVNKMLVEYEENMLIDKL